MKKLPISFDHIFVLKKFKTDKHGFLEAKLPDGVLTAEGHFTPGHSTLSVRLKNNDGTIITRSSKFLSTWSATVDEMLSYCFDKNWNTNPVRDAYVVESRTNPDKTLVDFKNWRGNKTLRIADMVTLQTSYFPVKSFPTGPVTLEPIENFLEVFKSSCTESQLYKGYEGMEVFMRTNPKALAYGVESVELCSDRSLGTGVYGMINYMRNSLIKEMSVEGSSAMVENFEGESLLMMLDDRLKVVWFIGVTKNDGKISIPMELGPDRTPDINISKFPSIISTINHFDIKKELGILNQARTTGTIVPELATSETVLEILKPFTKETVTR